MRFDSLKHAAKGEMAEMAHQEIVELFNSDLRVVVTSKGTELRSIKAGGVEYLWNGDPAVWGRRAPLLFPLIGRLRDGRYEHKGESIDAPMHGFCRDRLFSVGQVSPTQVSFTTRSDDETRACYPFDFRLAVTYKLDGSTLVKTHRVENIGTVPLPFEVGGHEAYALPKNADGTPCDWRITFGADDDAPQSSFEMFGMDESGILFLPKTEVELEEGALRKVPEQLDIDTIVLEDVPSNTATLTWGEQKHEVCVRFDGFPYLGIWTMGGQETPAYICIEPWSALPDAHFSPRELGEKPGVITLEPGEEATLTYTMTFK